MPSVRKVRSKLAKAYQGKVEVTQENGCIVLSGELERWVDVVTAGMLAAHEKTDLNVINNIACTTGKPLKVRTPRIEDTQLDGEEPDVLIIGGGITGCAAARELSRYNLKVLLIEKEHDIAMQATGRSTGLIHSGVKLTRGTSKLQLTKLGNRKMAQVCSELSVPYRKCGQFLVYPNRLKIWPKLWSPLLFLTRLYWRLSGIPEVQIIRSDQLHTLEPGIGSNVGTALHFPSGGVVCPKSLANAYAENSIQNGVTFIFDTMAQSMTVEGGIITGVTTNRGTIKPKIVINAAGLFCEDIAEMAGDKFYCVHPVKGTSVIIDKHHTDNIVHTAISLHGKFLGKHRKSETISNILRAADGTAVIGPFFLETMSKEDFSTDGYSVEKALEQAKRVCPSVSGENITEYYSAISATTYEGDFIVCQGRNVTNLIHAAGIQFPGITASPAIADEIVRLVVLMFGGSSTVAQKADFNPIRSASPIMKNLTADERDTLISANPDYGITICHCKGITKGEIIDALSSGVPCGSLDAVSRRIGVCAGNCRGMNCMASVLEVIAAHNKTSPNHVRKSGIGSEIVYGSFTEFIVPPERKPGDKHLVPALVQEDGNRTNSSKPATDTQE